MKTIKSYHLTINRFTSLLLILSVTTSLILSIARFHSTAKAAATISGKVFQDFNGNGVFDTTLTFTNDGAGTINRAIDRGIAGVTVTVYDLYNSESWSANTQSDGTFNIVTTDAGTTNPYRVEFTNLPAGYKPSARSTDSVGGGTTANSGSTIQFVTGNASNVNLAINHPSDYTQENPVPEVLASLYAPGNQATGSNNAATVLQSFPYTAGSNDLAATAEASYDLPMTNSLDVKANQIGTNFGLAYARGTRKIYAAAYFKRHAGFGPQGANAIYVINRTGTGAVEDYFTVPGAATNRHDTNNYSRDNGNDTAHPNYPHLGWDSVGKNSLGGLAISEDESTLFVMNLENRTLYALNAANGLQIASQTMPTLTFPDSTTCNPNDVRPFAVTVYHGQLYAGLVCSAESTATVDTFVDGDGDNQYDAGDYYVDVNNNGRRDSTPGDPTDEPYLNLTGGTEFDNGEVFTDNDGNGVYNLGDARKLYAFVYKVNFSSVAPASLTFDSAAEIRVPLNYKRGIATRTTGSFNAWRPWSAVYRSTSTNSLRTVYAQPMLTDIAFDNGNMILALRDRVGDQVGHNALSNPDDPDNLRFYQPRTAGDILRVCLNASGNYVIESNGRCNSIGSAPQNSGEGIGGGEYYFGDAFTLSGTLNVTPTTTTTIAGKGSNHDDTGLGGVEQLPGAPDVMATIFDPIPNNPGMTFDAGVRWLNNGSGSNIGGFTKGFRLYNGDTNETVTYGKAGGVGGNMVILAEPAPIEIGNRIWRDANVNGIQDANEPGINNVVVQLYSNGAPVTASGTVAVQYLDNFTNVAYNGSNGSTAWTDSWTEVESTNPSAGNVQVVADGASNNALRLAADGTNTSSTRFIWRAFDSTGINSAATLTFSYRRIGNNVSGKIFYRTGTSTWTELTTLAPTTSYQNASLTLPVGANAIGFLGTGTLNTRYFLVDNVQITATRTIAVPVTATTDSNGEYYFPSNIIQPNTNYELRVDKSQSAVSNLFLTLRNVNNGSNADSRDSDASLVGNYAVIAVTTGAPGSNDHTLDIGFSPSAPTAASTSISGRVLTNDGRGIRNVLLTLLEADGDVHYAISGPFGHYRFAEVHAGQTITVGVSAKRFQFGEPVRVFQLNEEINDLNFIANGGTTKRE